MLYQASVLGPSDLAAMRGMLSLFGEAFEDSETYVADQPTDEYLLGLLSSSTFIAIAVLKGPGS